MKIEEKKTVYFNPPWAKTVDDLEELEVVKVHETYVECRNKDGYVNQYTFNVIKTEKRL